MTTTATTSTTAHAGTTVIAATGSPAPGSANRATARWPGVAGRQAVLYRGWLGIALDHAATVDAQGRQLPAPGWHAAARNRLGTASPRASDSQPQPQPQLLMISGAGEYPQPAWAGSLRVEACDAQGLSGAWLCGLILRPRLGGERFQLAPGGLARSLKKQYQARAVPAWARTGPLLWHGDQLVYVPGLGVDARCWAAPGEPQYRFNWLADDGRLPGCASLGQGSAG